MKKVLNFFCNTKKGQGIILGCAAGMFITLVIGLILSVPIFWIGGKEYPTTWMNSVAPYFFAPFAGYAAFFLFLFVPYVSFIAYSDKYKGDGQGFMKWMSIFCSIVPGGFIYSFVAKALLIPTGLHNLAGMLIFGLFYLWIIKIILKKPFSVAQTFIPLS